MSKWAFLVHPRDEQDIVKVGFKGMMPKVNGLPRALMHRFIRGPKIVSEVKRPHGWVIGIPKTPEEMLNNPYQTRDLILKSVFYAYQLGARVIGLGELIAPLTAGGKWLLGQIPEDLLITSGNTLTAGVVVQDVGKLLRENFHRDPLVAIVGATGSVGLAVSKLLARNKCHLLLLARNENKLKRLAYEIDTETEVDYSIDLDDVGKCDLVVVLTSGSGTIIESKHLKFEAVVYDITQPPNVSPLLLVRRPDITFFKGGLINTLDGIKFGVDLQLPPRSIFACLAETLILAKENLLLGSSQLTGVVNPGITEILVEEGKKLGFVSSLLSEKAPLEV